MAKVPPEEIEYVSQSLLAAVNLYFLKVAVVLVFLLLAHGQAADALVNCQALEDVHCAKTIAVLVLLLVDVLHLHLVNLLPAHLRVATPAVAVDVLAVDVLAVDSIVAVVDIAAARLSVDILVLMRLEMPHQAIAVWPSP